MTESRVEHVNLSVSDPARTAALMGNLFGWRVRWEGPAMAGGRTIHVGSDDHYLALYAPKDAGTDARAFAKGRPLNHVGVAVDDLDAVEARVTAAGLTPYSHDDYEPGRRFYFNDQDGIEYEVVSYAR